MKQKNNLVIFIIFNKMNDVNYHRIWTKQIMILITA